jgi:hypothetical protein
MKTDHKIILATGVSLFLGLFFYSNYQQRIEFANILPPETWIIIPFIIWILIFMEFWNWLMPSFNINTELEHQKVVLEDWVKSPERAIYGIPPSGIAYRNPDRVGVVYGWDITNSDGSEYFICMDGRRGIKNRTTKILPAEELSKRNYKNKADVMARLDRDLTKREPTKLEILNEYGPEGLRAYEQIQGGGASNLPQQPPLKPIGGMN